MSRPSHLRLLDNFEPMPNNQNEYTRARSETLEDEEIDLLTLWQTLVEAKWLILAVAMLCTALAATVAFIMTPKYKAETTLTLADEGKGKSGLGGLAAQFGGLADIAGVSLGGANSAELMVAVLKSRTLLDNFIQERGLLQIFYAKQWDAEKKTWKIEDTEKIPTTNDAFKFLNKILSVNADKKTGLITLSIEWKDAGQAADWANDLVRRANKMERERAIKDAETSTAYLTEELKKTSVVEVQQAIYRLIEAQVKSVMLANTREQFVLKVLDPAIAADEKDFISPKRGLMIALGFAIGVLSGSVIAFVLAAIRKRIANVT